VGDDWVYEENARGGGISNLEGAGLEPAAPAEADTNAAAAGAPGGERNRILDLFKN